MAKDTYLRKVLGTARLERVRKAKVLMVGAGGIGCELLKDLLLCGFGEIHIVDLDTITLSNLNRQFLFRQKDIDKLKSLTVARAVQAFNYFGAELIPHHGNVMDQLLFPNSFWSQFDYIYNALDNLEARRYVNGVCLLLGKPLMESGTTGFDGQVQPIFPHRTECFDCLEKATPQTFPVCTIRSTPSQPVHCIVWAKEFLFNQLFSAATEKTVSEAELAKETDDAQEIQRILSEANELAALKALLAEPDFPARMIEKIYKDDVEKSLRLESLWKTRAKPVPLDAAHHAAELDAVLAEGDALLSQDTKLWTVAENLAVLHRATAKLQLRIRGGAEAIFFDKDDEDTLNFVAAAANLRSHVFHIPIQTKFDIKQIAGNIIPAIATTNAIISGFSNLNSLPQFGAQPHVELAKTVFISIKPNKRATSAVVERPNPRCASCGLVKKAALKLAAADDMLLQQFVDTVTDKYGYGAVSLILGKSKLIYDYDFDDNAHKKLLEVGVRAPETLLVQDEDDEWENLELHIEAAPETVWPEVTLRAKVAATNGTTENDEVSDHGETIVIDEEPPQKKRRVDTSIEID